MSFLILLAAAFVCFCIYVGRLMWTMVDEQNIMKKEIDIFKKILHGKGQTKETDKTSEAKTKRR